jgi:hypothetical protein
VRRAEVFRGAACQNRADDLLITSELRRHHLGMVWV